MIVKLEDREAPTWLKVLTVTYDMDYYIIKQMNFFLKSGTILD